MGKRSISIGELRAECQILAKVVMTERLATKEEVNQQRPGAKDGPNGKDALGWLHFYRWLQRTHAKLERGAAPAARALADATVLDALSGKPIAVTLVGQETPVMVYPKSLATLLHLHALDAQLGWATAQQKRLAELSSADALALLPRVAGEIAYIYSCIAWILTTKGPGMPYDADDPHPAPPSEITDLEPWDIIKLAQATHHHLARTAALSALIDENRQGEANGQRPSWSMFIGSLSMELGESPEVLARDRSLVSLLAAVRLRNAAAAPTSRDDSASGVPAGSGRHAMGSR